MVTSCVVQEVEPWEPVLMLEKNDAESQRPFFITYKDFEPLLSQALQNSSPYFRMEQDEWYTPFGRVERVDALSIKPTKLPNRISVLPITQDIPASDRAYFLNIYQNTKGKWITYVTEYLLEDGNSMSDVDIKSFTGRITQYSMDREILQELFIVNGSMTTSSNARTCGYRWDPYSYDICSGPVTGEEFCHDTFGYDLIPEPCETSPHDPVQIDENPWQGGGGGSVPSPSPFDLALKEFEDEFGLTAAEKELIVANPSLIFALPKNRKLAESLAMEFYPESLHNGKGDAFRHGIFTALNTVDVGLTLAIEFGKAHEEFPGNPPLEKEMDLYNNSIGGSLALIYGNLPKDQLIDKIRQGVELGMFKIIKNNKLVRSNE